jgi:anti-anti-sigma factor
VENHFRVEVRNVDDATVLAVSGELDLVSSPELEQALERVYGFEPELLILDLREVDFMDSAGLSVVVKAQKWAQSTSTRFGLVNGSPQVRRLLTLTGMDERITVVQTPEELLGGA